MLIAQQSSTRPRGRPNYNPTSIGNVAIYALLLMQQRITLRFCILIKMSFLFCLSTSSLIPMRTIDWVIQMWIYADQRSVPKGYMNAVLYFWFNCSFVENNRFVEQSSSFTTIISMTSCNIYGLVVYYDSLTCSHIFFLNVSFVIVKYCK